MAKNYDSRLVKSNRSYKIRDICRLFKEKKLHEQTVRGWINSGDLASFRDGKIIFVYGEVLKQFLQIRNAARKQPMGFDEFKCLKCRIIAAPCNNVIHRLTEGRSKSLCAEATCSSCGEPIRRYYSCADLNEIQKCFTVQYSEVTALYDSSCEGQQTHIKQSPKITLGEPLKHAIKPAIAKNITSLGQTHKTAEKTITTGQQTQMGMVQLEMPL